MCFNIAYLFVNTLLPRSRFCCRILKTPAEEADKFSYEDISKNELLNLHGIYITAIIKTIFIMGVRGSRNGYGNPKRISFLFVWNLAVHDN